MQFAHPRLLITSSLPPPFLLPFLPSPPVFRFSSVSPPVPRRFSVLLRFSVFPPFLRRFLRRFSVFPLVPPFLRWFSVFPLVPPFFRLFLRFSVLLRFLRSSTGFPFFRRFPSLSALSQARCTAGGSRRCCDGGRNRGSLGGERCGRCGGGRCGRPERREMRGPA